MNSDPQSSRFDRDNRPLQSPPGPLAKIFAIALSALFVGLAFMFSLVALAVVAVGGVLLWAWLWWKTRTLRKQMQADTRNAPQVIEGEFVRDRNEFPSEQLPRQ